MENLWHNKDDKIWHTNSPRLSLFFPQPVRIRRCVKNLVCFNNLYKDTKTYAKPKESMNAKQQIHIHLVSDSTGETTHQLARAALGQFSGSLPIEHVWTLVRTKEHLTNIDEMITEVGGVVFSSISNPEIRGELERICQRQNVPHLGILDHAVHILSQKLGKCQNSSDGELICLLESFDLPVRLTSPISVDDLISAMDSDKKVDRGILRFVVMEEIGHAVCTEEVNLGLVKDVWTSVGAC